MQYLIIWLIGFTVGYLWAAFRAWQKYRNVMRELLEEIETKQELLEEVDISYDPADA